MSCPAKNAWTLADQRRVGDQAGALRQMDHVGGREAGQQLVPMVADVVPRHRPEVPVRLGTRQQERRVLRAGLLGHGEREQLLEQSGVAEPRERV